MSELVWIFRGIDAISAPARTAMRSLRGLKAALFEVRREAGTGKFQASYYSLMRRQVRQLGREWDASSGAVNTFAAGVIGAGVAVGAAGLALGRNVVELAAFQQSAETTLAATMGNAEESAQAFRDAIQIANQTPLDTREVITAMNGLAAAGFRTRAQMLPMLGILTDVGALHGADAMSRFSLALGQVQARGALTMEELNQLREAAPSIAQPLMAALGQSIGASGPNVGRQVQDAIRSRRITAQMLNNALGEAGMAMNAHSGENGTQGSLGGIARAQSQTLLGSLSNLSNAWENLLLSFGTGRSSLAQGAGLSQFRSFIDSVTNALDATKPSGQRAIAVLRPLIDGVFGTLFRGSPGTSLIDTVLSSLQQATPAILAVVSGVRDFTDGLGTGFMAAVGPALELLSQFSSEGDTGSNTMRDLGQAVGFLAGAFVLGVGVLATAVRGIVLTVTELPDTLRLVWADITEWFSTVPGHMVDGFLGSLRTEWARLIGEVEGLTQMLPESVRSVLGIHSPSRVFAEIGLYTAEGMSEGITAGHADVERAMSAMVAPPSTADAGAAGRGLPPQVNIQIVIEGRGQTDEELAETLTGRIEGLFADLFERAALTVS